MAPASEGMSGTKGDLEVQIKGLKPADLDELGRRWRRAFGKPSPSHLPRHLIVAVLAYRLQANVHGDISVEHKRYLDAVGRIATQKPEAPIPGFSSEKRGFKPGTVFVREHNGVQHRVLATNEGLQWGNRTFSSLSAVASAITGTNWNGRRFFGLAKAGE